MNASTSREEIRDAVMAALRDFLKDKAPPDLTETTEPLKDLGLDSLDGVDFACVLSESCGFVVPDDLNPFIDDAQRRGRNLGEIIELMRNLLARTSP